VFGNGDTLAAVAVSSIGIWIFHFTVLRGVQQAAAINKIVTVAKLVPILLFVVILTVSFRGMCLPRIFGVAKECPRLASSSKSARQCS
jgi:amino acid transporter